MQRKRKKIEKEKKYTTSCINQRKLKSKTHTHTHTHTHTQVTLNMKRTGSMLTSLPKNTAHHLSLCVSFIFTHTHTQTHTNTHTHTHTHTQTQTHTHAHSPILDHGDTQHEENRQHAHFLAKHIELRNPVENHKAQKVDVGQAMELLKLQREGKMDMRKRRIKTEKENQN